MTLEQSAPQSRDAAEPAASSSGASAQPAAVRSPAPLILLIVISTVQPIALNMYVPAMGRMQEDLATTHAAIALTLSSYLIATAAGTLVVGILSDMLGRRPVLIWGLVLYVLGSLLCALAPGVNVLIFARVIQALGASVGLTLTRAVVRDIYGARESAKAIAYVTMGMAVAPMLAPSVGGVMSQYLGWRTIFLFMALLGSVVTIATVLRLGETHPPSGVNGAFKRMGAEALELFSIPVFWHYVMSLAFICTSFFAFIAGAAFLSETILGLNPSVYGLFFMCVAIGYIAGNFITSRFVERIGLVRMVRLGCAVTLLGVLLAVTAPLLGVLHPATFFGPMALVGLGNGFALPNAVAGAVSVRPHLAGTASGLSGAIQLGAGAITSLIVGVLCEIDPWPGTMWPVLAPMLIGILIAMGLSLMLRRGAVT